MPVAAPHTPLFLSAEAIVPSGSKNGLRNEALRNPFDVPIEVMEVRFHASQEMTNATGTGYFGPPVAGNALQVSLELGQLKLTNGEVPIWNFGRAENPTGEIETDIAVDGATPLIYNEYDWKLARPLIIPPGMGLNVGVNSTGLVLDPVAFRCSALCRVAGKNYQPSDIVSIPWIAPWISKQFQVGLDDVDTSRETDLVTPAEHDMFLHWITARMAVWSPSASSLSAGVNDDVSFPTMAYDLTQVKLRDSRGYPTIRDFTYWGTAFNQLTRSWAMDGHGFEVPAGTYWIADLVTASTPVSPGYQAQASLAMVGSYEVAYGDIR